MKIISNKISTVINFHEKNHINLIIEDVKLYRSLIADFLTAANDISPNIKFLNKKEEDESMRNKLDVSFFPHFENLNDNKINKKLYAEIEDAIYPNKYTRVISKLEKIVNEILESYSEFEIDYEIDNIDIKHLFKSVQLKLSDTNLIEFSFINKIIEYCKIKTCLLNIRAFVFIGANEFLDNQEYILLKKHIDYHGFKVLFLDRQQNKEISENIIIVDENFCEFD